MKPCPECQTATYVVIDGDVVRCPYPDCINGFLSSDRSERGLRRALENSWRQGQQIAAIARWEGSE